MGQKKTSARHGAASVVLQGKQRIIAIAVVIAAVIAAACIVLALTLGGGNASKDDSGVSVPAKTSQSTDTGSSATTINPDGEGVMDVDKALNGGSSDSSSKDNTGENSSGTMSPSGDSGPSHPDSDSMGFGKLY